MTPTKVSLSHLSPNLFFVEKIAVAIATMEGFFSPNTVAVRLNNPGNLDFADQIGAIRSGLKHGLRKEFEYAKFSSRKAGICALYRQIFKRIAEGKTLVELIGCWAPPTENNTQNYIQFVTKATGLNPDVPLLDHLELFPTPKIHDSFEPLSSLKK